MKIAHKTVLITGANRGIGRAPASTKPCSVEPRGCMQELAEPSTSPENERTPPLMLDVTNATSRLSRRSIQVGSPRRPQINNSGIAPYDDPLSDPAPHPSKPLASQFLWHAA